MTEGYPIVSDSLIISVQGEKPTARILSMLEGCCAPVRKSRLSLEFHSLPKGSFITMTIGLAISVTLLTTLVQGLPITVSAVDQDGNPTPPVGVTAASDNPSITVTPDTSNPLVFWLKGIPGSPASAVVTFTDAAGDTALCNATSTEPPQSTMLVLTPGTPV